MLLAAWLVRGLDALVGLPDRVRLGLQVPLIVIIVVAVRALLVVGVEHLARPRRRGRRASDLQ